MTLKQRIIEAFTKAGATWPADDTLAVPLKGAAVQCADDHHCTLLCGVLKDQPALMQRNAQLMVLICEAAGWAAPDCDQWIGRELRAAVKKRRKSIKRVGKLTFTLSVDHPPRLIVFQVEEVA